MDLTLIEYLKQVVLSNSELLKVLAILVGLGISLLKIKKWIKQSNDENIVTIADKVSKDNLSSHCPPIQNVINEKITKVHERVDGLNSTVNDIKGSVSAVQKTANEILRALIND